MTPDVNECEIFLLQYTWDIGLPAGEDEDDLQASSNTSHSNLEKQWPHIQQRTNDLIALEMIFTIHLIDH